MSSRPFFRRRNAHRRARLDDEKKGYFDAYANFSKSLGDWLIAYGIGAPVFFASQSAFARVLNDTSRAVPIIIMFLVGVPFQITLALDFKYAM